MNTILPGATKSAGVAKFVQDLFPGDPLEEAEKRFMRENRSSSLIQRLIDPEEIAHLVTYVSSPLASAINGAALRSTAPSSAACFEKPTGDTYDKNSAMGISPYYAKDKATKGSSIFSRLP